MGPGAIVRQQQRCGSVDGGRLEQRERGDESRAALGQDRKNLGVLLSQQAGQLGGLVGGDRAGHAENDGFT